MIQLTTFQQMSESEFDNNILQAALLEINSHIKSNAKEFRLLFEFESTSIESSLYKNSITSYFINNGFKIVNYPEYIYIDWGRANVYPTYTTLSGRVINDINYLGDYFTASELYLAIIGNTNLSSISYRTMLHHINNEIKQMNVSGLQESIISFGPTSTLSGNELNKLFAPELLLINQKLTNVHFSFLQGCLLQITLNSIPEEYTDIPQYILFGTRKPL